MKYILGEVLYINQILSNTIQELILIQISMFLSKKNAIYFNKPKSNDSTKPKRILGGWQDDHQQNQDKIDYTQKQEVKSKPLSQNLLEGDDIAVPQVTVAQLQKSDKKQTKQIYYLDWDELDARSDIQCEKKLLQEIVQPGGIRIKPSEAQLAQFFKQSKGMETHVLGSLLMSKIQVNYPFQIKAKALYTIQYMVKKNQKYAAYYRAHSQKLKDFPEPEDNVENYKKILKQTLNAIGINAPAQSAQNEPQITFVDPGYNDEPAKKATDMKTFISENAKKQKKTDTKRAIIGPGQNKKGPTQKTNDEMFGLDLLGGGLNQPSHSNGQNNNNQNAITFDQLLGSSSNTQNYSNFAQNDLI